MAMLFSPRFFTELRACLHLAIPLASAQLAQAANGFVDTVMMGSLGSETLAAGGLGATTFIFILIVSTGLVSAVSPIVAEAHGRHDDREVQHATVQGLWLVIILTAPITALLWNALPLLNLLGQEETTSRLAAEYLRAIAPGYFPALVFVVLRCFVSALSKPRSVMVIMVAGVVLNAIANYGFIYGRLGLPTLGLAGVGLASTVSYWAMGLALSLYILLKEPFKDYRIWQCAHRFRSKPFEEILRIGLPIGMLAIFESGLFGTTTVLAGQLGSTTLAAHHIALQTAAINFMVPFGISQATTVRVGQLMGQCDARSARLAGYVGIASGSVFMSLMAVVMITLPMPIISLYIDLSDPQNQDVIQVAIALLSVGAMFQLVDGIQVIAAGALRGLKDTRVPMFIGILSYWGIGFTGGYTTAFVLGLGGVGLWLGLALGLLAAAIALTWRFCHLITESVQNGKV